MAELTSDPILSQYQDLLDDLIVHLQKTDFADYFKQQTASLPDAHRFLLKMEIKRRLRACYRHIDLRAISDEKHIYYKSGDLAHYLTPATIPVFEQQLALYGAYTFGVYQAVMEANRNIRARPNEQNKQLAKNESVSLLHFRSQIKRSEKRLRYVSHVELSCNGQHYFPGKTSDISENGCKLKVPSQYLKWIPGNTSIEVEFSQINSLFSHSELAKTIFTINQVELKQDYFYLHLALADVSDSTPYCRVIRRFIKEHQHKYPLNCDDKLVELTIDAGEYFYSTYCPELAMLLDWKAQDGEMISEVMINPVNRQLYQFWLNDKNHTSLNTVLSNKRLSALRSQHSTTLYAFVYLQNRKSYFFSATEEELAQSADLKALFLYYASMRKHWLICQLELRDPLVVMRDISHHWDASAFSQQTFADDQLNRLKQFSHQPLEPTAEPRILDSFSQDNRAEPRYELTTQVKIECEDFSYHAQSIDFSDSGLKLYCKSQLPLKISDYVYISLPELNTHALGGQPNSFLYRLIDINKTHTIYSLKAVFNKDALHAGRILFDSLIDQRAQLNNEPAAPSLLNTLLLNTTQSLSFLIGQHHNRYQLQDWLTGKSHLNGKLTRVQESILKRIKSHDFFNQFLKAHLLDATHSRQTQNIYLAFNQQGLSQIRHGSEFDGAAHLTEWLDGLASEKLKLCVISYTLSKVQQADLAYFSQSMQQLARTSLYKARLFEEQLLSCIGIFQCSVDNVNFANAQTDLKVSLYDPFVSLA